MSEGQGHRFTVTGVAKVVIAIGGGYWHKGRNISCLGILAAQKGAAADCGVLNGVHISAIWRAQLNRSSVAAMQSCVILL